MFYVRLFEFYNEVVETFFKVKIQKGFELIS